MALNNAADVRSIEALREMHATVCKFRTDAQDGLLSGDLSIRRANDYLVEKLRFWQAAIRKCEEEVFQAKQELKQRQYVGYDGRVPDTTVQEENLKRAQGRLRYAQEKVETVRRWMTKLPNQVSEVYEGPARHLGATLESELPRALALLERRIMALEAYTALTAPQAPAPVSTEATATTPEAPPAAETKT
jgi:hypothetical protein